MSIQTEVNRLAEAKENIRDALYGIGIDIPSNLLIDEYAERIKLKAYTSRPFTIEVIGQGSGEIYYNGSNDVYYSFDDGETWTYFNTWESNSLEVNSGDVIMFKCSASSATGSNWSFMSCPEFNVSGNIASLLSEDNFENLTTITESNCFQNLFESAPVISAENLVLPATTLASYCYEGMFYNCTSLTTAPKLPATTLADYCYWSMFNGCTSLTTAPELPATTLAEGCYSNMFYGCSSLVAGPELPATNLYYSCYYSMFQDCTALTTAPELPATTLASYCYSYMFNYCTSLETAPELPAAALVDGCYEYMFNCCTSLNYIKCLATDISATNCTNEWVYGVSGSGTFVKAEGMADWEIDSDSGIPTGWTVIENSTDTGDSDSESEYGDSDSEHDYSQDYLTFVILQNGGTLTANVNDIYASTNGGVSWTNISPSGDDPVTLNVNSGNKVLIKSDINNTGDLLCDTPLISCNVNHNVEGNIMSIYDSTNFRTLTSFSRIYDNLKYVFLKDYYLISAENLVLPATTLTEYCYEGMFQECTRLTVPPELPATNLANYCYYYMFDSCTSLTTAPELAVTNLYYSCYQSMFQNCTSLTTAPVLPATTLADCCYIYMFYGCESLNYIKCLATDISATNCTYDWVNGVSATGTFVKNASMTEWTTGNNGIPTGWTVTDYIPPHDYSQDYLTYVILGNNDNGTLSFSSSYDNVNIYASKNGGSTWTSLNSSDLSVETGDIVLIKGNYTGTDSSPIDPVIYCNVNHSVEGNLLSIYDSFGFRTRTTLSNSSHKLNNIFCNDTSLISAENLVLPLIMVTNSCYSYMFYWCTSLETAPSILPATTLATECYEGMFGGCTSLTTAPDLPATTLAESCYCNMFSGCSLLTTAPELPATTLANHCYFDMFNGCTSLTTAPELPAATLVDYCYEGMFEGCSSLNYIKCLATDISVSECTNYWVYGVAQTGTFVKAEGMADWEIDSDSGIPTGWTVTDYIPDTGDSESEVPVEPNYSHDYLTYVILGNSGSLSSNSNGVYASTDGGTTWTSLDSTTLSVNTGDRVLLKGDITYCDSDTPLIECDVNHNIEGNMLSIYDSTGFRTRTTLNDPSDRFEGLFACDTTLISAENLVLPLTTLTENCYYRMFFSCSSLTTAPSILPATTLAIWCYESMFQDCTSLTTTPELPATTLAESCYCNMFNCCTNLNYIKCLATNISATDCTTGWVYGVAATGTFMKDSSMSDWTTGDDGIPSGWTVQNNV